MGRGIQLTANGCLPRRHIAEFHVDLSAGVEPPLEHFIALQGVPGARVFHVYVSSEVGLRVLAHLELHHSAVLLHFGEHVMVEVAEVFVEVAFVQLEALVRAVLVLLDAQVEVCVEVGEEQDGAGAGSNVVPRTRVLETARARLVEKRTWLPIGVRFHRHL